MYLDLRASLAEFSRVLRPGGYGFIYLVLAGSNIGDQEGRELTEHLGGNLLRPADIDDALHGAGFEIRDRVDFAGEWGERAQERDGTPGRRLLHAARLLRDPDRYISRFGEQNYKIMLGDCLWHVYRLLGKLAGYACTFHKSTP